MLSDEQSEGYKFKDAISEYRLLPFRRSGGLSTPDDRPNSEFSLFVDRASLKIVAVGGKRITDYPDVYRANVALTLENGALREHPYSDFLNNPSIATILPIDGEGQRRVWRWSDREKILSAAAAGDYVVKEARGEGYIVQLKDRIKEGRKPKTVWVDSAFDASSHGTNLLSEIMGGRRSFGYPKSIHATKASVSAVVRKSPTSIVLDYFGGSGTTAHAVIDLNRDDKGHRKYILVEQGDYFEDVLKQRVQKVVHSKSWSSGKPTAPETGISHAFKVLKIEGYEDALNNLDLKRSVAQASLLEGFSADKRDDYLMRYMLDVEAKGSLLSVQDFRKPFDYTLKVAVDSAGAWEERKVDLVETFNYLIGLTVHTIDYDLKRGFATVVGQLPEQLGSSARTLVFWRDCEKIGYEELERRFKSLNINPSDSEYDVVYINGDHNIPSVVETTEEEGSVIKKLMLRQIEPAFLDAMFNVDDV